MSYTVPAMYSEQFETNIHDLLERDGADWMNRVNLRVFTGKADNIPILGATGEVQEKSGRLTPTNLEELPHSTRILMQKTFFKAIPWETKDEIRMIADPKSKYVKKLYNMYSRKMEDILVAAALGGALGDTGSVDLPSGQKLAASGAVTFNLLQDVIFNFRSNNYRGKIHAAITPLVNKQLMEDAKVQNIDYTSARVLDKGTVAGSSFLDMDFFLTTAPELVDGGKCLFFGDDAITLGKSPRGFVLDKGKRRDLGNAEQISMEFDLCAVRNEEKLVFELNTIS